MKFKCVLFIKFVNKFIIIIMTILLFQQNSVLVPSDGLFYTFIELEKCFN